MILSDEQVSKIIREYNTLAMRDGRESPIPHLIESLEAARKVLKMVIDIYDDDESEDVVLICKQAIGQGEGGKK